jgi:hypothetical protein
VIEAPHFEMFNVAYRRVLDDALPEPVRFGAFLQCVEFYSLLTRQSFHAIYLRIGGKYGFDWGERPSGPQLVKAAGYLKDERAAFLAKLEEFAVARTGQKAQGRRRPTKRQLDELYAADWVMGS